jgi:hypothetical protein
LTRSRATPRPLWLITRPDHGRMEVLTIDPGSDGEALPVFSFEEEAETFLRFEALGTAWQVREASAGELISVLYGPCVGAKKVALDPLPVVDGRAVMDLVSLGRERFVRTLTDGPEPSAPCQSLPRVEAPAGHRFSRGLERERDADVRERREVDGGRGCPAQTWENGRRGEFAWDR